MTTRIRVAAGMAALALAVLPACGASTSHSDHGGGPLMLQDGWVKAASAMPDASSHGSAMAPATTGKPTGAPPAMTGKPSGTSSMNKHGAMTAVFGTLMNHTGTAIRITAGATPVAGRVEMHETVVKGAGKVMQPKPGGFEVPANGSLTLEPGGSHVMLMDLKGPLQPGTEVTITLTTSAGDVPLTVPVRQFAGGDENYQPGSSSGAPSS